MSDNDGGLSARVRTAEGWPVPNVTLTVTDGAGRQVARVPADAEGTVTTEPLPPGIYTAVLVAAGYLPQARTAQIGSNGTGSLGEVTLAPAAGTVKLPPPGPWVIDPAHSSVVATARHLGIASIKARFGDLAGRIEVRRPVEQSTVRAEIKAASIDTGVRMRDDHLRSPDFLDVDRFPMIEFGSTGLQREGTDTWTMSGELTLHGQCRPIQLDLRYSGYGPDPWGRVRAAFHADAVLHRNDFAIDYNAMVRAGVAAIGTTIKIELDIQAVQGEQLPEL
ncbi:YceI family protein [Amycolatopsis cihanbeyliensis]|uniref:Polyisoprenoid-binding protein YceI n=1 Tax=Amycolatopsis cihanbeyliensis TaxID=1128664 RepID=A0A542DKL9_AMYCI|nr:YceI family protein [Amycolatopsis cihanbeyliensis]TQJ03629.1 polyisoprenoid-binding protein YceI [Amycolatopsis cihanbeyliensis]